MLVQLQASMAAEMFTTFQDHARSFIAASQSNSVFNQVLHMGGPQALDAIDEPWLMDEVPGRLVI